ncbi:universal stress protein [Vibrio furnissii]|uniref:universal stress protein n=1 Tax=Vibrio furnissii TaxID=29494 RepID=UPI001EEC0E22|nr:universal stress protein [Vibrio furnissii]MCG6268724.1 universal stress protein [Vibrio furnissii]
MIFKRVLIPIDLSFTDMVKQEVEVALALIEPSGVIDIVYDAKTHHSLAPTVSDSVFSKQHQHAFDSLKEILKHCVPRPNRGSAMIRNGVVADEILRQAKKSSVDAIVMVSKSPKLSSYINGSTAAKIVRHSDCSVFVLKHHAATMIER